jgi:hypothetical protein
MPFHVCNNATLKCSMGMAPSQLGVLPIHLSKTNNQPAANINDHIPMVNIKPFGNCMSTSFPATAAATSAALGVLTPMPCIPLTPAPWSSGSPSVNLDNMPALNKSSTLTCSWGGTITVVVEGQTTHSIP